MVNDDDCLTWVLSSIQRLINYLPSSYFGNATNVDQEMRTYARIEEDTTANTNFRIELCNSRGLLSI